MGGVSSLAEELSPSLFHGVHFISFVWRSFYFHSRLQGWFKTFLGPQKIWEPCLRIALNLQFIKSDVRIGSDAEYTQ
jgi:hypothetical protein